MKMETWKKFAENVIAKYLDDFERVDSNKQTNFFWKLYLNMNCEAKFRWERQCQTLYVFTDYNFIPNYRSEY